MSNAKLSGCLLGGVITVMIFSSAVRSEAPLPVLLPPESEAKKGEGQRREKAEASASLGQIEKIHSDTLLFEAQMARARALLALQNSSGYDMSPPPTLANIPETTDRNAQNMDMFLVHHNLPRIIEIYGRDKHLHSRLLLANGTSVGVTEGQGIPGSSYTVKRISAQEVQIITVRGETHSLVFVK